MNLNFSLPALPGVPAAGIVIKRAVHVQGACIGSFGVAQCAFFGNFERRFFTVDTDHSATVRFSRIKFQNGSSTVDGGAILIARNSGPVDFSQCSFHGNKAPHGDGGAVAATQSSRVTFAGCTFAANTASNGGTVALDNVAYSVIVAASFFIAEGGVAGGTLHMVNGRHRIIGATFQPMDQGAAWNGGVVVGAQRTPKFPGVLRRPSLTLYACTFLGDLPTRFDIDSGVDFNVVVGATASNFHQMKLAIDDPRRGRDSDGVQRIFVIDHLHRQTEPSDAEHVSGGVFSISGTSRQRQDLGNVEILGLCAVTTDEVSTTDVCRLTMRTTSSNWIRWFYVNTSTSSKIVLENLQLEDGSAPPYDAGLGVPGPHSQGGGAIFAQNVGSLELISMTFNNNTLRTGEGLGGGAVSIVQAGSIKVSRCVFKENRALVGNGGALSIGPSVSLDVFGTTFKGNEAVYGGAVDVKSTRPTRIATSEFRNNRAFTAGGAISTAVMPNLRVSLSRFAKNYAIGTPLSYHIFVSNNVTEQGIGRGTGWDPAEGKQCARYGGCEPPGPGSGSRGGGYSPGGGGSFTFFAVVPARLSIVYENGYKQQPTEAYFALAPPTPPAPPSFLGSDWGSNDDDGDGGRRRLHSDRPSATAAVVDCDIDCSRCGSILPPLTLPPPLPPPPPPSPHWEETLQEIVETPSGATGVATASAASASLAASVALQGGAAMGTAQILGVVQAVGMLSHIAVRHLDPLYFETAPRLDFLASANVPAALVDSAALSEPRGLNGTDTPCVARWREHTATLAIASAESVALTVCVVMAAALAAQGAAIAIAYRMKRSRAPAAVAANRGDAEVSLKPPPEWPFPRLALYPPRLMLVVSGVLLPRAAQACGFAAGALCARASVLNPEAELEESRPRASSLVFALGGFVLARLAYIAWVARSVSPANARYEAVSVRMRTELLRLVRDRRRDDHFHTGDVMRFLEAVHLGRDGRWVEDDGGSPFVSRHGAVFEAFRGTHLGDGWVFHPCFAHSACDAVSFTLLGLFAVPCACNVSAACAHVHVFLLAACAAVRSFVTWRAVDAAYATRVDARLELAIGALWLVAVLSLWLWHVTEARWVAATAGTVQYALLWLPVAMLARGIFANVRARLDLLEAARRRGGGGESGESTATTVELALQEATQPERQEGRAISVRTTHGMSIAAMTTNPLLQHSGERMVAAQSMMAEDPRMHPSAAEYARPVAAAYLHDEAAMVGGEVGLAQSGAIEAMSGDVSIGMMAAGIEDNEQREDGEARLARARENLSNSRPGLWRGVVLGLSMHFQKRLLSVRSRLRHVHRPSVHGPRDRDGSADPPRL